MRVDYSPITFPNVEPTDGRSSLGERELLWLVGISFVAMWATIFLVHGSPALVFQYGDNAAYRDVANGIRHWDFRNMPVQHFMGYPYFIAAVSLLLHIPTGFALW